TPRGMGKDLMGGFGKIGAGSVVGFADSITLGSSGFLSDSENPVMDLKVTDSEGREVGNLLGLVYLRGYAKDRYNRLSHTWEPANSSTEYVAVARPQATPPAEPANEGGDGVRFEGEPAVAPPGASAPLVPNDEPRTWFRDHITLRRPDSSGYLL